MNDAENGEKAKERKQIKQLHVMCSLTATIDQCDAKAKENRQILPAAQVRRDTLAFLLRVNWASNYDGTFPADRIFIELCS